MKLLILLSLVCLLCISAKAQSVDTTLTKDDYRYHSTHDKTWVFTIPLDTIADGDTLTIDFPHDFGTAFAGMIVLNTAVDGAQDPLTGFYRLFQAACDTCDYVPLFASTALTTPAQFTKTFDVHLIKLRLMIWSTADDAQIWGNMVVKPSSISSD
jgi:hypothetical protein